MNGSSVGMRPFLALSTACVIPAAFHPFKMIFEIFEIRVNYMHC